MDNNTCHLNTKQTQRQEVKPVHVPRPCDQYTYAQSYYQTIGEWFYRPKL